MDDNGLLILHSQYHGCWCPGDTRSQGICSHGIDSSWNILLSVPEGVTHSGCDEIVDKSLSGLYSLPMDICSKSYFVPQNYEMELVTYTRSFFHQYDLSVHLYICLSVSPMTAVMPLEIQYHQASNISHTLVGNKIVDHSDVVGASPIGKGIKNGCPCIVEISGTQGCALVGDPAWAGEASAGT